VATFKLNNSIATPLLTETGMPCQRLPPQAPKVLRRHNPHNPRTIPYPFCTPFTQSPCQTGYKQEGIGGLCQRHPATHVRGTARAGTFLTNSSENSEVIPSSSARSSAI
jgi:hypothetical protein